MKNIDLLHVRIFRIFIVICCLSWHCVVVGAQVLERVGSLVPVISHPEESVRARSFVADDIDSVRQWDEEIDSLVRAGVLRRGTVEIDTILSGRQHERLLQYYRGVPVYGGEITRELIGGISISLGGTVYESIDISPIPTLGTNDVEGLLLQRYGEYRGSSPTLVILPMPSGLYALAYAVVVPTDGSIVKYFVDAHTGEILDSVNLVHAQTGVSAEGTGLLGDSKKVSVTPEAGMFWAADSQRPAWSYTVDFRFDWERGLEVMFYGADLVLADLASDPDNTWTDGVTVDTHAYIGWTYDYLFDRFSRNGIDGKNGPLFAFVNWFEQSDYHKVPPVFRQFFCNAFWFGGAIFVGNGLPSDVGQCRALAVNFDVIAHELAHGITAYTSQLEYRNESGALNEAFSDVIGNSAEWYHAGVGSGLPYETNYRLGELSVPGGFRDMADPGVFGYPDHYGARWRPIPIGDDQYLDNGGVHINSSVVNHAFFLAVEGGTNQTSGLSVQGVGRNNRQDVEHAFYRAFAYKLTKTSTMRDARIWTINQAETDATRNAIRSAWDAVGVYANQQLSFTFDNVSREGCSGTNDLNYTQRIRTGNSGFTVSQWQNEVFKANGLYEGSRNQRIDQSTHDASSFRDVFGQIFIPPHTTVTSNICWTSKGNRRVFLRSQLTGTHSTGEVVTHYSGQHYVN